MVAFGDVTILEFPIILGDNPGCSGGAPITIGWKPCGMPETHDVDMYEYMVKKEKSDFRFSLLAVLEHEFNNHINCNVLWCK